MGLPTVFSDEATFEEIVDSEQVGLPLDMHGRHLAGIAISRLLLGALASIQIRLEVSYDKIQWYRVRSSDDASTEWYLEISEDVNNTSPPEGGVGSYHVIFDTASNTPIVAAAPYARFVVIGVGGVSPIDETTTREVSLRLSACG